MAGSSIRRERPRINKVTVENLSSHALETAPLVRLSEGLLIRHAPGEDWRVTFLLTGDREITRLNSKFMNSGEATDVLAFDTSDRFNPVREGEVYISVDRAADNAVIYKVTLEQELFRLVAHGLFHLFGYSDSTASGKEEMTRLEDEALARFHPDAAYTHHGGKPS